MLIAAPASGAQVALYSSMPAAAAVIGAAAAVIRRPGETVRSYIQHFAAGVIFAIVAGELLVDLKRIHAVTEIIIGFCGGVLAMLTLRSLMARFAPETAERPVTPVTDPLGASNEAIAAKNENFPLGFIVAVAVDLVVDGLLIGVGFAAGAGTGRLLAIALTIELLSLGLAVAVQLSDRVASRWRVLLSVTGLAILFTITAVSGATLFRNLPDFLLATVLSFGVAALLFLVTEELLVEAHEVPETPVSTAMFFLGFLSLFILELVG